VARLLIDRGYRNVRPLAGGIEAWVAAGFETEAIEWPSEEEF
jgi:rhodanese-related sulfurtransferase